MAYENSLNSITRLSQWHPLGMVTNRGSHRSSSSTSTNFNTLNVRCGFFFFGGAVKLINMENFYVGVALVNFACNFVLWQGIILIAYFSALNAELLALEV